MIRIVAIFSACVALATAAAWAADGPPCAADSCQPEPQRVVVETRYYQNASKVGGTALAMFPLVQIRYGLAPGIDVLYETPSEIAVSGTHGNGVYYMTHPGIGARFALTRIGGAAVTLTAEAHPALHPLANTQLVPIFESSLGAQWSNRHRQSFMARLSYLNAETLATHDQHASVVVEGAMVTPITRRLSVRTDLRYQSHALPGEHGQTSATVGLQRTLGRHTQFNMELGTAFNAAANSKPHYFGFGFVIH